jgi:hypothetical protein
MKASSAALEICNDDELATETLSKMSKANSLETMGKMGCWSVLDQYKQYVLEELEPGEFREKIDVIYGVGIFFQQSIHNGKFVVSHLNPGSAACLSKRILVGDVLFTLNSERVLGWDWDKLRRKMFGPAGSFIELDFIRKESSDNSNSAVRNRWIRMSVRLVQIKQAVSAASSNFFTRWIMQSSIGGDYKMVRINLMRGSPEFCQNTAAHDLVQAQQMDLLVRKKSEEEALCCTIENRVRLESALFAEVSPWSSKFGPQSSTAAKARKRHPPPLMPLMQPLAPMPHVLSYPPLTPVAQVRTRLTKVERQQAELRRALAELQASLAQAAEQVEEAEAEAVGEEWFHLADHDPRDLTKYGLNSQLVYAEEPFAIIA